MREGYLTRAQRPRRRCDRDQRPGRVRRRRRRRSRLPPGHHLRRRRLHGGARCRPLSREARRRQDAAQRKRATPCRGQVEFRRSIQSVARSGSGTRSAADGTRSRATSSSPRSSARAASAAHSGWEPRYLTLHDARGLAAAVAAFVKTHSFGEFVFDFAWARAYERVGRRYYPKLTARRAVHPRHRPAAAGARRSRPRVPGGAPARRARAARHEPRPLGRARAVSR